MASSLTVAMTSAFSGDGDRDLATTDSCCRTGLGLRCVGAGAGAADLTGLAGDGAAGGAVMAGLRAALLVCVAIFTYKNITIYVMIVKRSTAERNKKLIDYNNGKRFQQTVT